MEILNEEEKTLIHISHLHPLKLIDCHESNPICHACHGHCIDQSYGCDDCFYFLHTTCASFKKEHHHPSHPTHTLNLLLTPPYTSGFFSCDACDGCGGIDNKFCLHCNTCNFDLHLPCAALPEKLIHPSHPHSLELVYENPYAENVSFLCDYCEEALDVDKWFYLCKECDYGGHIDCFTDSEKGEERLRLRNERRDTQPQHESSPSDQMIQLFQLQQKMNTHMMALKISSFSKSFI